MTRRRGPYRVLIDMMVRFLVKEHRGYTRRFPNDLDNLIATLKPGDVVLVATVFHFHGEVENVHSASLLPA